MLPAARASRMLVLSALALFATLPAAPGARAQQEPAPEEAGWTAARTLPITESYGRPVASPLSAERADLGGERASSLVDEARPMQDPGAEPEPLLFDDSLLRQIDIEFEQSNWVEALDCSRRPGGRPGQPVEPQPTVDIPVTVTIDGERLEEVGIRCKGNSSLSIEGNKKPLNLTLDAFVPGQDLWGHDIINLNNGFADPTLLREAIGYRMFRDYMPVPRFGFARVTVDDEFLGVYLTAEQISGEWSDHWFPDDDGIVIKGDSPIRITLNSSELTWQGEDLDDYKSGYEVKGKYADSDEGYIALREMIRALDAPVSAGGLSEDDFEDGIWQALDVDVALWYLAGNNLITNFDSYYAGHNYYMYLGRRDPRFNMLSWDLNLSFGLFGFFVVGGRPGRPGNNTPVQEVSPFVLDSESSRPLISRILAVPGYRADYLAHYRTLLEAVWTEDWVREVGGSYQTMIAEAAREEERSQGGIAGEFSYQQFLDNFEGEIQIQNGGPFGGSKPGILSLVEQRGDYLRGLEALEAPDVRLTEQGYRPAEPSAADPVEVRARFEGADRPESVELRYRVRGGTEVRLPMEAAGEDPAEWRATIPAQRAGRVVTFAFRTLDAGGRAAFFPEANWTYPLSYEVAGVELPMAEPGDLVINELMAANETTLADEAGQFDDWVELYNRGSAPIALDGLYLSDDPADPWAYALPDIQLAPGEHLLIWCDNDPDQGPLHAPFRLDRQGEAVSLASQSQILDLVEHGEMEADVSLARLPDGSPDWESCFSPSPGTTNACSDAPVPTPTASPVAPTPDPGGREGQIYLPALHRQ